jgi:hypothetical protein
MVPGKATWNSAEPAMMRLGSIRYHGKRLGIRLRRRRSDTVGSTLFRRTGSGNRRSPIGSVITREKDTLKEKSAYRTGKIPFTGSVKKLLTA